MLISYGAVWITVCIKIRCEVPHCNANQFNDISREQIRYSASPFIHTYTNSNAKSSIRDQSFQMTRNIFFVTDKRTKPSPSTNERTRGKEKNCPQNRYEIVSLWGLRRYNNYLPLLSFWLLFVCEETHDARRFVKT